MSLYLSYLLLGAFSGTIAGLLGLGGGIVIVPALVIALEIQGVDSSLIIHMAIATSLATILLTSLTSIYTHHQNQAIRWEMFGAIAIGIMLGAVVGVETAINLPAQLLLKIFGGFLLVVALMITLNVAPNPGRTMPGTTGRVIAGAVIGWFSALLGIGGGTLSVPFFSWCNLRMQQAIGLAAACGLPIALAGTLVNIFEGWGRPELPPMSLGHVYLPALLAIVLTSMPFARLGANLASKIPAAQLKQVFALALFVIGIKFIF